VRPKCQPCTQRGRKCHYVAAASETRLQALKRENKALRSQKSPYESLIEVMKSVSERDASDILARLRFGADIETMVSHVTNGDLLLQLSVAPETRFRYDFPYNKRMPASLLMQSNAYLQSPIYDPRSVYPSPGPSGIPLHASISGSQNTPVGAIYLRPFHVAEVVDLRLADLNISAWTAVCDNNELMRSLLRRWLHCEYHFAAAFQIDLFLEDLRALREDYCSSLLVNIVLGYACVWFILRHVNYTSDFLLGLLSRVLQPC
jgi:hypothetical protein